MGKKRIYEAAKEMNISTQELIGALEEMGMENLTPLNTISEEDYQVVKELYAKKPPEKKEEEEKEAEEEKTEEKKEEKVGVPRPPVISILGHVDHGKTTLLDYLRKTRVAAKEAGGITQSIGAYQIEYEGEKLTFIDTPGHEAFTQMRARGARVMDIAILMVAADDGVMAQTKEAIQYIREANVPLVAAINKIDKRNADLEQVKRELASEELNPEEWGGDTVTIPISALTGENVDELLEMLVLLAEMEDFRADPSAKASGIVFENFLDTRMGPIASVVIKDGTLKTRESVVVGETYGRIKALIDENGNRVDQVGPGRAAQILGLSDVPPAGVPLEVKEDLNQAKEVAKKRKEKKRKERLEKSRVSRMEAFRRMTEEKKKLKLILKAGTRGGLEALEGELEKLDMDKVELEVLESDVGEISENDVLLASSGNEKDKVMILGFNTEAHKKARELSEQVGVSISTYDVIYELTEGVEEAMKSLIEPTYKRIKIGQAEVRNTFNIPGTGRIAGCYVKEGRITRDGRIRVVRNGSTVHDGEIASLKRFEEDVAEVGTEKECGLRIRDFEEVEIGDRLDIYQLREVKP